MIRVIRGLFAASFCLAFLLRASPLPAQQEAPESILRLGYLAQRVVFDQGYGAHLQRRFGASYVDLTGVALSGAFYRVGPLHLGLELDILQGGFNYVDLNGREGSADFYLQQHVVRAHWIRPGNWELAGGAGHGYLVRTVEGYREDTIDASNVSGSGGVAQGKTHGAVFYGEVLYRLLGTSLDGEVGLRYGYAPHWIPRDDPRPALDEANRPVDSWFNVGGFAYLFTVAFRFGGTPGPGGGQP